MKYFTFIILLFLLCCSDPPGNNKTSNSAGSTKIPEQTPFTKTILDSLGNINAYQHDEYILYCRKGSYSEMNIELLITQIDSAILRIKEVLKINEVSRGFYLVMLDSREEMGEIFGNNYKGLSLKNHDLALFVYNPEIRPYFKHELFHLISNQIWGNSNSRVLNEGGAMFADNTCLYYEDPITVINKYLYENNMWFDLKELIDNFSEKASENDMIAYLQAAFIFRYLYNNYEEEMLINLWQKGFAEMENIYGFDLPRLNNLINIKMNNTPYQEINWAELMEKGCG